MVHNPISAPMPDPGRLAMCAGVALYLGGLAAFRRRMLGQRSLGRVVTAVALLALYVVSGGFPAWSVGALIAALVGVLCAVEAGATRTRAAPLRAAPAREPETEVAPPSG